MRVFSQAGLNVRLGTLDETIAAPTQVDLPDGTHLTLEPLLRNRGRLGLKDFDPCTILVNNDLSAGVPRVLQHLHEQDAGGVLADDMGLGKTLQTIAHLCVERESGRAKLPTLIVAPTSLIGNWQREFAKFAPSMRVCILHGGERFSRREQARTSHVCVTTYPALLRDSEYFAEQHYHYVILDEAQTIKNHRSRAHEAVRSLR